MRGIGCLLLVLVGFVGLACNLPSDRASPAENPAAAWRRTNRGWEQLDVRPAAEKQPRFTLHPAIVGGLQILLTLAAAAVFAAADSQPARRPAAEKT